MKKLSALILALALLVSVIPVAYAANATPNTTTLTTTVPSATYVLNIPADQTVTFGEIRTYIGNVTVTDSKNFADGKNVDVTVEYGRQVDAVLKFAGYGFDKAFLKELFGEKSANGKTVKGLRDAVTHGIDSKAVQEITDRKAELFGYMDTFLSEIRTAA